MPYLKVDLMIERIDELRVHTAAAAGALACLMDVVSDRGEKLRLALSRAALEKLCTALIENSPRTPGTPGRH